ncbi:hypothetical protein Q0Z83_064620 [Actinoplanes sichuanensis]|uniref:Condensation domain-containing protein n=1 Tax=Actinoplanes sichuanensis TaxID=512349 RepID=A0ABW4AMQ4_9ACTN|nr:condensation domain-containing protein [Actinoplanes sichuanensis]BEL08271.1 hypothetical protein Q0Z83_064620 [Actinoplanes sichuanensis]
MTALVWDLLSAQAAARPDAVAVRSAGRDLSYAELVTGAERLARTLGGVTGVHIERSTGFVVALVAAMRAGTYLPLDPALPVARREELIRHAGVTRVVTESDVDAAGDLPEPRTSPVRPGAVAYVLHTSGSTGAPKGVTVTHEALAAHLLSFGARIGITTADRTLLFAQPTADVHVEQVLAPLVHGATLVLHPPGVPDVPAEFLRFLDEERVTVANVPAGYWRLLAGATDPAPPRDLHTLIVGSDVMPADAARRWLDGPLRNVRLVNAYGPTETVITASLCEVGAAVLAGGPASVPLGTPPAGRSLHVLGPDLRPAESGEIYLGGILAQGYLDDPRRTAAAFVPSPFEPGARLYRTGDQARRLADGSVEFLGRVDRQVKIRGFRVELGAIEAAAVQHPAVTDCVAVTVRDTTGERRITLLTVPTAAAPAAGNGEPRGVDGSGDLLAALRAVLPPAAVPHRVLHVEALPLTPAGKIDHAACQALAAATPVVASGSGIAEPFSTTEVSGEAGVSEADGVPGGAGASDAADELEVALLAQWRAALNVPVGPDDDFITAGGDSMTSLALACQAPQLGVTIRPRDIFEAGTVRALARRIRADRSAPAGAAADPAPTRAVVSNGLTPALHWLIDRLGEVPGPWAQYVLIELAADVDVDALRKTVEALPHRYPALRTPIRRVAGQWQTLPTAAAHDCWAVETVPVLDEPAVARIRDEVTAWLDPAAGRHLRATLLLGPDGDRRLLIVAHHAVVDVVSWRLLTGELDASYHLVRSGWGAPAVAPAPAVADWVRDLHTAVASGAFDAERDHWERIVAALPGGEPDEEAPEGGLEGDARTSTVQVRLDGPEPPDGRLADVVLAAALTAWQRWTGRSRCVVEMESPGRDAAAGPAGYDVVGWLTALYPVPVELAGEPEKNLAAVRAAVDAVPGDGSGYGILRYLHPDRTVRDALRLPSAPDVSANFRGRTTAEQTTLIAPGSVVRAGPARGADLRRPCPVVIDGWVDGDTLVVTVELDGSADVAAVGHELETALRALLTPHPRELPLTPAQEGILFHAVQSSVADAYVGQLVVELTGPLDRDAFAAAWRAAAQATPPARTSFAWRRQLVPAQRIAPNVDLPVRYADWTTRTGTSEGLAEELAAEERATRFDLETGPLLRVALARIADGRHLTVVTHHHLVFDGWSMNLLVGDVLTAYAQARAGKPPRLAPRPAAAELVAREPGREPDEFWARHLAGARPTRLIDGRRQRSGTHRETTVRLAAADWAGIRRHARDRRLVPAALLHLAWATTLRERLGQDDVTFGTVMSGRDARIPGIESASGMLINTLPLRVRSESAGDVAADLLALQERQGASLVEVRRWAGLGPRDVLFDHLLDFGTSRTMVSAPEGGVAGLELRPLHGFERTNYGITITAVADADLELSVNHDDGLLTAAEAEDLLAHLSRVIRTVAGAPHEGDGL